MKIARIITEEPVRIARGLNAETTSSLDVAKANLASATFEEDAIGVLMRLDGAPFARIPWVNVRQVIYAAEDVPPAAVTKPETPAAKGGAK